jgi:hypothetical protein
MFVPSGTFEEIAAFLEGYNTALNEFASEEAKATGLREFGRWLSYTHENSDMIWLVNGEEVAANLGWSSKIRRLYPVDDKAFEALPHLYRQFLDDPQRVSWPAWPSRRDTG